ncbi:MAG: CoA transferase [Chloroflexi bacterium]|nr:CoA transferase [Chloroflexota bacterium]
MAKLPLEGIRVLDFCVVWAGPFATQILADLGAEVVKVENVHFVQPLTRGFWIRPTKAQLEGLVPMIGGYPDLEPGQRPWNRCPSFNNLFRNKYSMTVDLRIPSGMEILKRLIKECDVFYENNVTETMDKLGISYEMLKEIKPDIIMVRVPAYGSTGPYKNYRALGVHLESAIGHSMIRGYRDSDPTTNSAIYMGDYAAGAQGAFAVTAALHYRKRTGKGQLIELSQAENAISFLAESVMDYTLNRRVQGPLGNRNNFGSAPCGAFPAKGDNDWINITVSTDAEWEGLCQAMGDPDWAKEEIFSDQFSRWQNSDDLEERLGEWTSQHEKYEAFHILQKHGVPAGPVMHARDCYSDPHIRERGFFKKLTHPEAGTHDYPGFMFTMSRTPPVMRQVPCLMGEHNEYVYKQVLKVSDEEYAEIEREGHIGMDYDPELV